MFNETSGVEFKHLALEFVEAVFFKNTLEKDGWS
jgi:hypothetical protein